MSTLFKVARYHLVDWVQYVALPWSALAFTLLVNLVVFTIVPSTDGAHYTGVLAVMYGVLFVLGVFSVARSLPFGFALGLSRRSYFLGTIMLVVGLAAVYSMILTLLNVIEGATGGWGARIHFFRVPWILDGPWPLTWLTSSVAFVLLFIYGMWFGLVYRRWSIVGLVSFVAAQVVVLLAGALVVTWTEAWSGGGEFFATLSALGLTGVLAAVATGLALGGFTTMRRVTV